MCEDRQKDRGGGGTDCLYHDVSDDGSTDEEEEASRGWERGGLGS